MAVKLIMKKERRTKMKKSGSFVKSFPGKLDFGGEEKKEEGEFGGQENKEGQENFSNGKTKTQTKNKRRKKIMYYALYGQHGSGLILSSDISEEEVSPEEERRNFAVLCSSDKSSLEHRMPRTQEYLQKNGVTIVRSDIPVNIWY
ncbi:MAG: hypothetical protein V1825_00275 [Candidatus Falkowbacteria bacterium]